MSFVKSRLFLSLFLLVFGLSAAERPLVIIHTNDLHARLMGEGERLAGFARIAAYIKKVKRENRAVLVLDAGDAISGTPVSTIFAGTPVFEIMNRMGYDAMTLGNHEFDHGWRQIEEFKRRIDFPVLCANVLTPEFEFLADRPYQVFQRGGIDVGVLGVVTPGVPGMVMPEAVDGLTFLPLNDTASVYAGLFRRPALTPGAGRTLIEGRVPPGGCEIVIVLSHAGFESDAATAALTPGVDLIIGGHSHNELDKPMLINGTWVAQAGAYGSHVGRIDLVYDDVKRAIISLHGGLIPATELPPPDPEVAAAVNAWEETVADLMDVRIGATPRVWDGADLKLAWEAIMRQATGAPFAYYNEDGIRAGIIPGEISLRDIWECEPFGNTVVVIELDGGDLGGIVGEELKRGGLKPVAGQKVRIATNSFVAAQKRRFFGTGRVREIENHGLVRDALAAAIKNHGMPEIIRKPKCRRERL